MRKAGSWFPTYSLKIRIESGVGFIIAIMMILGLSSASYSQSDPTTTQPKGTGEFADFYVGASLNPALIAADFMGFEGTIPCCEPYGNNLAVGYGLFVGKEFGNFGLGKSFNYDIRLGLNNLNSAWSDEYFVSHRINGSGFDSLYSNNNYDISIFYLGLRNYLRYEVVEGLELGGFIDISVPIVSSYDKSETVAQDLPFTFENGEKSRINQSGSIEDLAMILPSVGAAVRYEVYRDKNILIKPEAEVGYTFLNLANGKDISTLELRLGVSVGFLPQTDDPIPAPLPQLPEPEKPIAIVKPSVANLDSKLLVMGNEAIPGDTVVIFKNIERTQSTYSILPRIFYRADGAVNDMRYEKLAAEAFSIKDQIFKNVGAENRNITLKSYYIVGSNFQPESYLSDVMSKLNKNVIVNSVLIDTINNDLQYKELVEEYRRVDILSDGEQKPIDIDLYLDESTISENDYYYRLNIEPDSLAYLFVPTIREVTSKSSMMVNGKYYGQFPYENHVQHYQILLSDNLNDTLIEYDYFVRGEERLKEFEYRVYDEKSRRNKRQYLLGYNSFDESDIVYLSEKVKKIAEKALREGKTVTVIASTDDLGDPEYNKALAKRRANKAVQLFGNGYSDQLDILLPEKYIFDNNHPYGRQLNRAILIRIGE